MGTFVERIVEVKAGITVFGKYFVQERLGRGGMGEVWLVKDKKLDAKRALKIINPGASSDPETRARFRREARVMAQFTHPNVVTVHDSTMDLRDTAFIVMEYVPGISLDKYLRSSQPRTVEWVLPVLTQLCEALQEAHAKGIVHRDLKPSNLMLVTTASGREVLKVLDFGIAKILGAEVVPNDIQTRAGDFVGTPPYTSPEQSTGEAEPRSDLYSVGVILYEFLTGRRPFLGPPAVLISNTMYSPPPPFAEANPEVKVAPEVERVVMHCLAKKPEDRPESAMALLAEFKAALVAAPPSPPPVPPPQIPRLRRGPALVGLGAALAIVALVVIQYRRPTTIPSNSMQPGDSGDPPPRIVTQPKTTLAHVENDGRHYDLWKGTIYLPAGYTPVDPKVLAEDGYPREIKSSYGLIFVRIVKGRFMMGARDKPGVQDGDDDVTNRPAHRVDVPGYYIQKYEVTNGELAQYLSQSDPAQINGSVSADGWRAWYDQAIRSLGAAQAARHPARQVPWLLAAEFAKKRGGWLPTEAQWEFAARSRSSSRVFIWDAETDAKVATNSLAHLFPLPMADGIPTAEVGIYPEDRTLQGVMDMAGNIREWCRDPWVDYKDMPEGGPTPLTEVPPPAADTKAVVRGGSYNSEVGFRFVTRRGTPLATSEEANDVGFRMVIEDARLVH